MPIWTPKLVQSVSQVDSAHLPAEMWSPELFDSNSPMGIPPVYPDLQNGGVNAGEDVNPFTNQPWYGTLQNPLSTGERYPTGPGTPTLYNLTLTLPFSYFFATNSNGPYYTSNNIWASLPGMGSLIPPYVGLVVATPPVVTLTGGGQTYTTTVTAANITRGANNNDNITVHFQVPGATYTMTFAFGVRLSSGSSYGVAAYVYEIISLTSDASLTYPLTATAGHFSVSF